MDKMIKFKNKKEIFNYIKKKFIKDKLILIRGSAVNRKLKAFYDIDVEVYTHYIRKPYYEIIFLKRNPILISAYFYKYKKGKYTKETKNVKVILGNYNKNIKPNFKKDIYNNKQRIIRECQLVVDFMFKYLRKKDKKYINDIQKRIKIKNSKKYSY